MSLIIGMTTPEGIILAGDSRQTYKSKAGVVRIGSDSATKIYPISKYIGVAVAGSAFLEDFNDPESPPRSIGSYIEGFANTEGKKSNDVGDIAKKLNTYLINIYNPEAQLERARKNARKRIEEEVGGKIISEEPNEDKDRILIHFTTRDGQPAKAVAGVQKIHVMVAGYDHPKDQQPQLNLYMVNIPGKISHVRGAHKQELYGSNWEGQKDVIQRIIKGFAPELEDLSTINAQIKSDNNKNKMTEDLKKLEYIINWGTMNLFDAVRFATLMIETTSAIQKFSDGTVLNPGGIPGVGGDVDIAVIDPIKGFMWHKAKQLELDNVYE